MYEFRDPIHGFIELHAHERRVIDTPAFQRLRRIHQLGLSYYIYHGAEHSRFGHSLGVMHLAGQAFETVFNKNVDLIRELKRWRKKEADHQRDRLRYLARLAGLLHDIGHAPFSHTGEAQLFPYKDEARQIRFDHEDYGVQIIRLDEQIRDAIDEAAQETDVTADEVCQILDPAGLHHMQFLREIVSSSWDVDKMDYLLRDSHYCGVEYGSYDLRRLVMSLTLNIESGEPKLAFEEDGLHAVEALIVARYFMFAQVYFHDVRRSYDLALTSFMQELMRTQYGKPTYPSPEEGLQEYISWDDARVMAKAVEQADEEAGNEASRIANRRHLKAIFSTSLHPPPGLPQRAEEFMKTQVPKFPEVRFEIDKAVDHPERYKHEPIWVLMERAPKWRAFAAVSKVAQAFPEIGQVRIYADVRGNQALEREVGRACDRFFRDYQQ